MAVIATMCFLLYLVLKIVNVLNSDVLPFE